MFELYTERARKVVVHAQSESQHFNHDYVGTEHLLLGLLREDEGVAACALSSLNVTLDEVREQVGSIVGYGEKRTGGKIPLTSHSKEVLELAFKEALDLGHDYIGTEHILLGLVRESEGVAARVLSSLGIDSDKVRREVVHVLESRSKSEKQNRKTTAIESEPKQNRDLRWASNTEKDPDPDLLNNAPEGDRSQPARGEVDSGREGRRWRGLAAILAGVVLMVAPLLANFRAPHFELLYGVVWLLLLIALPGLQARQTERSGSFGLLGTSLANIGAAALAILFAVYGVASFFEDLATSARFQQPWQFLISFPAVLLLFGLTLFGLATFRAGVLPRWGGIMLLGLPLAVALMTNATPIPILGPSGSSTLSGLVSFTGFLAFAIGAIWLGYTLAFERRAVPRLRDIVFALGVGLMLQFLGILILNRTVDTLYTLSNLISFAAFVFFATGLIWLGYALWSGRDDPACWGALLLLALGLVLTLEILTPLHQILSPSILKGVSDGGLVIFVTGLIWLGYALWSRGDILDQPTQRSARPLAPIAELKSLVTVAPRASRRSISSLKTRMKRADTGTLKTIGSTASAVPEYTSYLPESNRAGVFISYAREDKDFMRALHQALAERDRDTWIDWEKIPPTAKWLEEIYSGIRGSDAFVFVISPDSVNPESFCHRELAYAVEHNKRLVPIMYRDVNYEAVPSPLNHSQWIYFRESDDFDEAFQTLLKAIDTDQQWVRQHTRLLVWATDWSNRGRDNSRVLHGSDLREAEEWQVQTAEKEPKPTQLQTEYITASRKAATRRQRVALGAVTFGLIVAVVLGIVALLQRNEASLQRDEALEQANIAISRQLAAQAELKANSDPQLATLLSVAAFDTKGTPEAQSNLLRQLDRLQHINRFLSGHTDRVRRVAFSPDGRTLATSSGFSNSESGQSVILWDVMNGSQLTTLPDVGSAVFSQDGSTLVAVGEKNAILWDVAQHAQIGTLPIGERPIDGPIALSPDGHTLAIGGVDFTKIDLWDTVQRAQVATLAINIPDQTAPAGSGRSALAFSPDGSILAADGPHGGDVTLWDVNQLTPVADLRGGHGRGIFSLTFSPDGHTLASGGHDAKIVLWDVAQHKQLSTVDADGDVMDVAFSPDGRTLASADGGKHVILWDVDQHMRSATLSGHTNEVDSVAFSPDGGTLASGGADAKVILWDLAGHSPIDSTTLPGKSRVFSPDGHSLATGDGRNITVWDTGQYTQLATLPSAGIPEGFSADGSTLIAGDGNTITLWDVTQGSQIGTLPIDLHPSGGGPTRPIALSPDGRTLAIADDVETNDVSKGNVILWDIVRNAQLATLPQNSGVFSIAFSPDGATLAAGGINQIVLWDVALRTQLATLPGHNLAGGVLSVAFSPDGHTFASAALDQAQTALGCAGCNVILWDLTRRTEIATLSGHTHEPTDVTFSPDGRMLASGVGDEVILWSVDQHAQMYTLTGGASPVVFSPDGHILASGDGDTNTILWDVDVASWRSKLCAVAGRDLSKEEWATYMAGRPYQSTCS